jgi:hypothetical protein
MSVKHSLSLFSKWDNEDEGRRMLVDQIVSLFPDAIVDGEAKVTNRDGGMVVTQNFRSPMFDRVSEAITATVVDELDTMMVEIEESSLVRGSTRKIYKQALMDAKERIQMIWGFYE